LKYLQHSWCKHLDLQTNENKEVLSPALIYLGSILEVLNLISLDQDIQELQYQFFLHDHLLEERNSNRKEK
jgi:hypothetical protein